MRIIADFHIHSKYSRATSQKMDLDGISRGAKLKGLNLVGTGDFTHPLWLKELKSKLREKDFGIYEYKGINFILTTEVNTDFEFEGKIRRVHHVIHAPSFEIVEQINEALSKFGDLTKDGRPTLKISAPELVEILMQISKDIFIYPAHAWTPHFGIFGSRVGFSSIEECYQDMSKYIYALETGLSSDPPMNWRLSKLDKYTLISNSDSHSPHTWRIGREANFFELKKLDYKELHKVIKKKDPKKFLFTLEVNPNYGKYHYTGHRNCGVCLHPKEAMKLNNICPVCGKKLTIGVLQRVEELADREEGFRPKNSIDFKTLLPLYELISHVTGIKQLYSEKVLRIHDSLIKKFGNELRILLEVKREELEKFGDKRLVDLIMKNREGKIKIRPGYDGVYGEIVEEFKEQKSPQSSLSDFLK